MHICFAFEQAMGRQNIPAAKVLRSIMRKFRCRTQESPAPLPPLYDGTRLRFRQAVGSVAIRDQIDNTSMPLDEATTVLNDINDEVPYAFRIEFIRAVAAFVAVYKVEVNKPQFGKKRKLLLKIAGLCGADQVEYLFNHQCWLASRPVSDCLYHPSGTSSNEALHHVMNSACDTVTGWHRSTLELWCKIMHHRLLTLHEAARDMETVRQHRRPTPFESPVFDRFSLYSLAEWAQLRTDAAARWQHAGPSAILSDRRRDKTLVQRWMARRQAGVARRPASAIALRRWPVTRRAITHRTVFSKTPRQSLRHM